PRQPPAHPERNLQALPRELLPQALQAGRHAGALHFQGSQQPVRGQEERADRYAGRKEAPPDPARYAGQVGAGQHMAVATSTPAEARRRQPGGAALIDVREPDERALGMAEGALGVARGELEAAPGAVLPDADREIVLICEVGGRSLQAAEALAQAGYRRVASVEGGTRLWRHHHHPLSSVPRTMDLNVL